MQKDFTFRFENAGIEQAKISQAASELDDYLEHLQQVTEEGGYQHDEGTINLPSDQEIRQQVQEVAQQVATDNLKYIVVVGIGGSNLGAQAVYEALRGNLSHLAQDGAPQILFADTPDPEKLRMIGDALKNLDSKEEVVLNVITKSGGTTETIANFEYLVDVLRDRFDTPEDRIVATTGPDSDLWQLAEDNGFARLPIPEKVGGRFSVFSAVGQLPLELAGIDVDALLQGAADARTQCLGSDIEQNMALTTAVLLHQYYKNDVVMYNNFFFNPSLESTGKWYRQLLGESIGKQYNRAGEEVRTGITPMVSIGSVDLHSMAQLYFGGPKDKFTTLVYIPTEDKETAVPEDAFLEGAVSGIYGKSLRDIMTAIYGGVKATYQNEQLPFTEILLEDLSPYTVGAFLQYNMVKTMLLGKLFAINPFDQPNVEGYKSETRKLL